MEKKAEEIRQEEYRKYQHGTQGIDVYEEGAFMAGFTAGELYAAQRVKEENNEVEQMRYEKAINEWIELEAMIQKHKAK